MRFVAASSFEARRTVRLYHACADALKPPFAQARCIAEDCQAARRLALWLLVHYDSGLIKRSSMKVAADLLSDSPPSRRWGLIVFGLFVIPALAAIWLVPYFVTQDGPLHLLNAHITLELLKQQSAFNNLYTVHWSPLPYWAGHLFLTGLLSLVSE